MLTNMKFHNICTELKTPPKFGRLLRLNLPFCLESPLPDEDIAKTMKRLRGDVVLKIWLHQNADNIPPTEYNPQLPSECEPGPEHYSKEVESRIDAFEQKLLSINNACRLQKPRSNTSYQQRHLMNFLKRNPDHMAIATDKGLGAALITIYNNKSCSEHLSDRNAYKEIPPNQIHTRRESAHEI